MQEAILAMRIMYNWTSEGLLGVTHPNDLIPWIIHDPRNRMAIELLGGWNAAS
jgi:hypothetical protein